MPLPPSTASDEVRLMARVAHLYYDDGMRQTEIGERLNLSQTRVSRLLKRALDSGLVRVTVLPVPGLESGIERDLQDRYGLGSAIVVDLDGRGLVPGIGASAAYHLETTIRSGQRVGVSSRSASLLGAIEMMRPLTSLRDVQVVQVLGGMGDPSSTAHANRLTELLADRTRGEAVFLVSPAVAGSASSARAFRKDPYVTATMDLYARLDVAVVGLGVLDPPTMLGRPGNVFTPAELDELKAAGAVGDVCLRFFDRDGQPVRTPLTQRIIGITIDELRAVGHCVCIAGGAQKRDALLGGLRAGFIDVLVTDRATAELLVSAP
jgi:DNA-binding transcriptional regulator LsrR (DeoR family)